MGRRLTIKQRNFIKNIGKGMENKDAAIVAGYSKNTASSIANHLMKQESIRKALENAGVTDEFIALGIKKTIKAGLGVKATADTSLRAMELAMRAKGQLEKEHEQGNTTNIYVTQLKQMNTQELQQELARSQEHLKELQDNVIDGEILS